MSDPEGTHRVVHKRHIRGRGADGYDVYEVGDRITPTPDELRDFGFKFEPVPESEYDGDDADADADADADGTPDGDADADGDPGLPEGVDEDATVVSDPGLFTVPELEDALGDVDDAEALRTLLLAEEEGDDRKTAKAAIQDRLDDVEAG